MSPTAASSSRLAGPGATLASVLTSGSGSGSASTSSASRWPAAGVLPTNAHAMLLMGQEVMRMSQGGSLFLDREGHLCSASIAAGYNEPPVLMEALVEGTAAGVSLPVQRFLRLASAMALLVNVSSPSLPCRDAIC